MAVAVQRLREQIDNLFELDKRLQADTEFIGDFPLCRLLLLNDVNYPWVILVPRRVGMTEVYQLNKDDRQQLLHESCVLASAMQVLFTPDKLNIATIGNMVSQLHMHHVARYVEDLAWPSPVWGANPASPYSSDALASTMSKVRQQPAIAQLLIDNP